MCEIRMISGIFLVVHILTALQHSPNRADREALSALEGQGCSIRCRRGRRNGRDRARSSCIASGNVPPCIT